MKQNLGITDRILRFALGFWFLGPLAPAFSFVWLNWVVIIVGLIALLESFIGWCGLHNWFGINNKNQ